jgi:hypothetical protein
MAAGIIRNLRELRNVAWDTENKRPIAGPFVLVQRGVGTQIATCASIVVCEQKMSITI